MREQFNARLKEALKAKDQRRVATLRLITAAIKDRDIAVRSEGKTDGVDDAEILQILQKMVKQRVDSAKTYEEAGRIELAEQEREEMAIIEEFLPKQMSAAEIEQAVNETVTAIGAENLKDMGRTMAALKEKYPGAMDFKKASGLVKAALGG